MRNLTAVVCSVLFAGLAWAQPSPVAGQDEPPKVDLLVFAPHPDDEVLSCAGIIRQALVAGKRVKIVIFTNGDGLPDFASALAKKAPEKLTVEDFLELARYRQKQTQEALAVLGGKKEDLIFLGYPDSGLDQVYESKGKVPFQQKFTRKSETFGVAQPDYHSAVHGRPAPYTHEAALADVVELIRAFKPLELYVTNEADVHRDHKAAFRFVRDAVKAVGHRCEFFTYVAHGGPEWLWPRGFTPKARFAAHEVNGQQAPLGVPWPPTRRVQLAPEVVQLKLRAIQASMIPLAEGGQRTFEARREFFESFAKVEEVFWAVEPSPVADKKPATPEAVKAEKETRYLAFQIFTHGPNPKIASMGEGKNPQPAQFPDKAVLRNYIEDIKKRIGTVGDQQTRLAVMLGQLAFDHGDAETTKFIEVGFELALETDVAVGFHIDDSMFWAKRKDLWSDPKNVEALDWDGTPCMGRRLDWGKEPSAAPPQMCFNSKVIQREVRQRSALLGKAIQEGVNRLQQRKRPELFAGVIAGSETEIGQDFKTGKYLGYRALLNRGFSRERPPQDMDFEREKVVQEFIEQWSKGLADAGVSPQKIYSHTCFLSRRAFNGDDKEITYMKRKGEITYSQHNHFAPASVAFGKHHRPGFSTYPQAGLFEDIYEELAKHKQVGWASCEGTNMQPASGPGQSGMNMETYLAKMFNHGATLTNVQSWGVGGEAMKTMGFRVVTAGEEALRAYRKFLKGVPLVEGETVAGLTDRLPPKIHKIQKELPAWIQKTGNKEAAALMQKMQEQLKAKNFEEVEKTADSILKMMGEKP